MSGSALAQSSGAAAAMPIAAALVAPAVGLLLAILAWRLLSRVFSILMGLATAALVLGLLLAADGRLDLSRALAALPAPFGGSHGPAPEP